MIREQPQVELRRLYSTSQTAAILQVSENTVRNYANAGRLNYKVSPRNGRRVYLGSSILRFWENLYL